MIRYYDLTDASKIRLYHSACLYHIAHDLHLEAKELAIEVKSSSLQTKNNKKHIVKIILEKTSYCS